jgi:hypothetical protein
MEHEPITAERHDNVGILRTFLTVEGGQSFRRFLGIFGVGGNKGEGHRSLSHGNQSALD